MIFLRRCSELAEIGRTGIARLEELRETGHVQWQATSWELAAGEWEKDPCFFGQAGVFSRKLNYPVASAAGVRPFTVTMIIHFHRGRLQERASNRSTRPVIHWITGLGISPGTAPALPAACAITRDPHALSGRAR